MSPAAGLFPFAFRLFTFGRGFFTGRFLFTTALGSMNIGDRQVMAPTLSTLRVELVVGLEMR